MKTFEFKLRDNATKFEIANHINKVTSIFGIKVNVGDFHPYYSICVNEVRSTVDDDGLVRILLDNGFDLDISRHDSFSRIVKIEKLSDEEIAVRDVIV